MTKRIIVVDDDGANLQIAGHILSRNNMRVTALYSGKALLDHIAKNGSPDLILLDIKMPEMDGFETLEKLRILEKEKELEEVPVIFLTANDDAETETHGFEVGVSDYIRKPFDPDVLLHRIDNILSKQQKLQSLKKDASYDGFTGFLNKVAAGEEFSRMCSSQTGCLMMIDLDSFKLVNDIYGHEMGDKVLKSFVKLLSSAIPEGSRCARLGGDEFAAFCPACRDTKVIAELTSGLNEGMVSEAKALMGEDMEIPIGASVGAVFVPDHGNDYDSLLKLADRALYSVKQKGKHGYAIYSADSFIGEEEHADMDIQTVSKILGERSIPNVALQLDKDSFAYVYRYVMRYIVRNQKTACKVMFTLSANTGTEEDLYKDLCNEFGNHIREVLRKSDIFMRNRANTYFVFLTDIMEDSVQKVIQYLLGKWYELHGDKVLITYETEFVGNSDVIPHRPDHLQIVVVDDDTANLQIAGHILSRAGFHVIALKSGRALLNYLEDHVPSLILLDVKMPGDCSNTGNFSYGG